METFSVLSRNQSRSTERDWENASTASSIASVAEYTGNIKILNLCLFEVCLEDQCFDFNQVCVLIQVQNYLRNQVQNQTSQ